MHIIFSLLPLEYSHSKKMDLFVWLIVVQLFRTSFATSVQSPLGLYHASSKPLDEQPKLPGRRKTIPGLYKRPYGEITWIGAHDSPALRTKENGWSLSGMSCFFFPSELRASLAVRPRCSRNTVRISSATILPHERIALCCRLTQGLASDRCG